MITDWIVQQKVLLPIDHNDNEIFDNLNFLKNIYRRPKSFVSWCEKNPFKRVCAMAWTVHCTVLKHNEYCLK